MQLTSNCNHSNEESVKPAEKSLDFLATFLLFICLLTQVGKMSAFLNLPTTTTTQKKNVKGHNSIFQYNL